MWVVGWVGWYEWMVDGSKLHYLLIFLVYIDPAGDLFQLLMLQANANIYLCCGIS